MTLTEIYALPPLEAALTLLEHMQAIDPGAIEITVVKDTAWDCGG